MGTDLTGGVCVGRWKPTVAVCILRARDVHRPADGACVPPAVGHLPQAVKSVRVFRR